MHFFACILTKYPFISQIKQILPQKSIKVTGGQIYIFPWHQNHIFLILLFFVDLDTVGSYEAVNETLTFIKIFLELSFKINVPLIISKGAIGGQTQRSTKVK